MTTPREKALEARVLEMVASGKISAADGDALLKAMSPPGPSFWTFIFQPAARLSPAVAIAIGAVATLSTIPLERLGIGYNGAFDVHAPVPPPPLALIAVHIALAWPWVALVFWAAARLAGKPGRFVDFFGAVGLARFPYLLVGLLSLPLRGLAVGKLPSAEELALVALVLPVTVWAIALLCTGFRTVSGLRGARLVVTFIAALLVAEALSKLVLAFRPF